MKRLLISMLILAIASMAHGAGTGLTYHEIQFVDETGAKVTDISSIQIYNPDSTTNAVIYMDSGLTNAITQPITTSSTNTTFTQSAGTVYWWGADGYDYTFTNGTNIARNAGHRTRTASEGRLWFPSYLADISSAEYEDDESIAMGDDADFTINAGTTGDLLTVTPLTNGTSIISLGTTAATSDVKMWGDTAGYDLMWDATDNRLEFADNAILGIGNDPDWYITHNGTTTTATGAITHASAATFSTDVTLTGNAYNVEWDNSSDTLHLLDSAELGIGGATTADGDVVLSHNGTTLAMTTIRTDEPWTIGGTTYGFDITYAFETAGQLRTDFDGDFINLTDDMDLRFGTGAGSDGDFQISSSSAPLLTIGQIAAGVGAVAVGVDDAGLDWTFYGDTASQKVWWDTSGDEWFFGADAEGVDVTFYGDTTLINAMWDESANLLSFTGAVNVMEFKGAAVDAHETLLGFNEPTQSNTLLMPDDTGQILYHADAGTASLSGAGAIPITDAVVLLTTTGTDAWTLADGYAGQILSVVVVTDGGAGTITPASCTGAGWATMIFTNDGEGASFMFVDATIGWVVLGTYGLSTQPLITQ